ncbi:hypothetical protein PGT21_019938 [Puccinia graminis f. sp. tritici]|uniref:Uncharacterized protein n=1 Tax=Puccinia graminis f. sp. tritici TaxID=56615 RepID=A0A5B0M6Z2_PUCGR|nr:hypothetical protein PGT21_019938 [Puccinia graminis f. sp. tritici]
MLASLLYRQTAHPTGRRYLEKSRYDERYTAGARGVHRDGWSMYYHEELTQRWAESKANQLGAFEVSKGLVRAAVDFPYLCNGLAFFVGVYDSFAYVLAISRSSNQQHVFVDHEAAREVEKPATSLQQIRLFCASFEEYQKELIKIDLPWNTSPLKISSLMGQYDRGSSHLKYTSITTDNVPGMASLYNPRAHAWSAGASEAYD